MERQKYLSSQIETTDLARQPSADFNNGSHAAVLRRITQTELGEESGTEKTNNEEPAYTHQPETIVFMNGVSEETETTVISYADWKSGKDIAPGFTILGVPPRELFTTQDWVDPEKMGRAHYAQQEDTSDAFTVKGVLFPHPKSHMGTVPVLLDGNHRTVNAAMEGNRVNFQVVSRELPQDAKVWRVSNLVKISSALAR